MSYSYCKNTKPWRKLAKDAKERSKMPRLWESVYGGNEMAEKRQTMRRMRTEKHTDAGAGGTACQRKPVSL